MRVHSRLAPALTLTATLLAFPHAASAAGAWVIDRQFQFTSSATVGIVGPFVDGESQPWVLGNVTNPNDPLDLACVFIGPVDRDNPPNFEWRLPETEEGEPATLCLSVEPGPEDGFLIRGVQRIFDTVNIPPEPPRDVGFIVRTDADFEIVWGPTFDEEHVEVGTYDGPLERVAWSDDRDRVLVFFNGIVQVGADSATQLHGISIAESTGLVRRVVSDWGGVSNGALQGLLVRPSDGRFLVVAHANGTEFLLYDGLESLQALVPGDVAWSDETVDYVQFGADESLYIAHHPRIDFGTVSASLTRASADGAQLYTRDLARTVTVTDPESGQEFDFELQRPILSYVTASTATFVRALADQFVLHVLDNFNGQELAVQPLLTVDSNAPTHLIDARAPDQLILMTAAPEGETIIRFVDVIGWEPDEETPGEIGTEDVGGNGGDAGSDAGDTGGDGEGTGGSGGGGSDDGCCQMGSGGSSLYLAGLALGLLLLRARSRRANRSPAA